MSDWFILVCKPKCFEAGHVFFIPRLVYLGVTSVWKIDVVMSQHANARLWMSIVKPLSESKEHTLVGF